MVALMAKWTRPGWRRTGGGRALAALILALLVASGAAQRDLTYTLDTRGWAQPDSICYGVRQSAKVTFSWASGATFDVGALDGNLPSILDGLLYSGETLVSVIEIAGGIDNTGTIRTNGAGAREYDTNGAYIGRVGPNVKAGADVTFVTRTFETTPSSLNVNSTEWSDGESDVNIITFRVVGAPGANVGLPWSDVNRFDNMFIAAETRDGVILNYTERFNTGQPDAGVLSFTIPDEGYAFLRYYVGDLSAASADVQDGGCKLANETDSDGDGLTDYQELLIHGTAYLNPDTDGDGLSDGAEVLLYGTNPLNTDTDGDGLSDYLEVMLYGTNPLNADTDGDGLSDALEVLVYGTNPLNADTDGDGLPDGHEVSLGTDPLALDTDGDGLLDGYNVTVNSSDPRYTAWADAGIIFTDDGGVRTFYGELSLGTDPLNADTDGDGLSDGAEVGLYGTNPLLGDSDGDGLSDYDEIFAFGTDPLDIDTDGDGLLDGFNVTVDSSDPRYTAWVSAGIIFTDEGGLRTFYGEQSFGTDPLNGDTDGDGVSDADELFQEGSDPLRAATTTAIAPFTVSDVGEEVTLTITVTSATLAGVSPTGTVTLRFGESEVEVPLVAGPNGTAVAVWTGTLPEGSYDVVAVYAGDERHSGSESAPVAVDVLGPITLFRASEDAFRELVEATLDVTLLSALERNEAFMRGARARFADLAETCDTFDVAADRPWDLQGGVQASAAGVRAELDSQANVVLSQEGCLRLLVDASWWLESTPTTRDTLLDVRIAADGRVGDDALAGVFANYVRRAGAIDGTFSGSRSVSDLLVGAYGLVRPVDRLVVDAYAALGLVRAGFDVSRGALDVESDFGATSFTFGASVSGELRSGITTVRPALSVSYGSMTGGTVPVTATAFGVSESLSTTVTGARMWRAALAPTIEIALADREGSALPLDLSLSPSLDCNLSLRDEAIQCGWSLSGEARYAVNAVTDVSLRGAYGAMGERTRLGVTLGVSRLF